MERDFSQELKSLQQNEIPNLWDRIEAGLPEKKKNAAFTVTWQKWAPVAAACLCLAVVLSVLVMQTGFIDPQGRNDFAATGDAAAEVTEEAAESGVADGCAEADGADAAGGIAAADESDTAAEQSENLTESAVLADDMQETEAAGQEEGGSLDGQLLQGITVQILEAETIDGENFYRALILQSDDEAVLKEGAEIEITDDGETQYDVRFAPREEKRLKEGECYEVSLRHEADGQEENGLSKQTAKYILVTAAK